MSKKSSIKDDKGVSWYHDVMFKISEVFMAFLYVKGGKYPGGFQIFVLLLQQIKNKLLDVNKYRFQSILMVI